MAGNSLNLVDMVNGYLTGGFGNQLSSLLGESKERTQLGIEAAVPGLLAGLDNTASTPDGAQRLASAVDSSDSGVLSNLGSIFGKTTGFGPGALASILGTGGLSELTGNLGRTSGLSRNGITTLLGVIAPIVMGVLKRVKQSQGLDSAGLSNLLSSQRDNSAEAMPEGMSEPSYARESIGGVAEEPYPARPVARTRKPALSWLLPLALLAILAGLIWNWASHSPVRAGREEPGVAQENKQRVASLKALVAKYSSAIQEAQQQGVQISSMTEQNGKLVIRGTAPSTAVVDRFRELIKRTNPNMDDVVIDLSVKS
jgi:Bacterial protein of unknown function (DUF937)